MDRPDATIQIGCELMLPKSYYEPAMLFKLLSLPTIPCLVILDLLFPPGGMAFRRNKVHRASVPETTVNENTDFPGTKQNVGLAPDVAFHLCMNTVTQS